jgi:hypothetical protein
VGCRSCRGRHLGLVATIYTEAGTKEVAPHTDAQLAAAQQKGGVLKKITPVDTGQFTADIRAQERANLEEQPAAASNAPPFPSGNALRLKPEISFFNRQGADMTTIGTRIGTRP